MTDEFQRPAMPYIANHGQAIAETNSWDTEMAQHGYGLLSFNAGAVRLLIPDTLESSLPTMLGVIAIPVFPYGNAE